MITFDREKIARFQDDISAEAFAASQEYAYTKAIYSQNQDVWVVAVSDSHGNLLGYLATN